MIDVPAAFAQATVLREGPAGRRWLASLPAVLDSLLRRWSRVPAGPVWHGFVGVVVPVLPAAVIKVSFPHPGNVHEPDAFAVWNGRGAARLLARADEHFAMLVEQAGPGTLADVADFDSAVTVLGRLSRRLAVPADLPYFGDLPHLGDLPRLSDLVAAWPEEILADSAALGHPLPRRFVDAAIATVRELGGDQPATLVHGDLHDANVLAATREPWLAVDPKGCVGDPCYDTVTVLRSARFWPLLSDRARLLRGMDLFCSAAGLDPERARRWAHLRAVRAAFWGRRHGDPDWLVEATDRLLDVLSP